VVDAPSPGTLRAGRYAVIGVLGSGSQAETLDAVDKRDGRAVAIKRFQVRGAKSWKDVELAEREARVLATLDHPNLPVYVEHFEEAGALYLVMEKIEGEALSALRRRKGTLALADIARFLRDADSVLAYLHSRKPPLIHRDIKPGNVIRRGDGSFAFVDFGSVRDQLKPEGGSTVVGTFGYMAPEQFQGRALPGSDVYAVGATALSLVTGREPEDLPHRGLGIDVPAALGRGAEPWLVRVLSAMLEPDPDKRATRVPSLDSERGSARPAQQRTAGRADWRAVGATIAGLAEAELRAVDLSREHRHQLRDEGRRLRKELKEQLRDQTRRARREARSYRAARRYGISRRRRGLGPAAPLLMSVVALALTLARVANFGLFRVLLPTLLFSLSWVFGRPARRAAHRCMEVGLAGDRGLQSALEAVRGRLFSIDVEGEAAFDAPETETSGPTPPRRTRVADETGQSPVEFEDEDEKWQEDPRGRSERR